MSDLNKCILLVMKWLDNKDSVSKDELLENRKAAYASANTVSTNAAYAADCAASCADDCADDCAAYAGYWVNEYFVRSGENKQDYIDAIEAGKKPQEPESKEWEPKVGEECEGLLMDQANNPSWMVIELLYDFDRDWAVKKVGDGTLAYCDEFRPLKTDKEKDREAFIEKAVEIMNSSIDDSQAGWAAALFDADFKAPEGE